MKNRTSELLRADSGQTGRLGVTLGWDTGSGRFVGRRWCGSTLWPNEWHNNENWVYRSHC